MSWTEIRAARALANHFGIVDNLIIPNYSTGLTGYEADLIVVRKSNWAIEVEIKISIADLRSEFKHKPEKHRRLLNGMPIYRLMPNGSRTSQYRPDQEDWKEWDEALAACQPEDQRTFGKLKTVYALDDWRKPAKHHCREYWIALPLELIEKAEPIIPAYAGILTLNSGTRGNTVRIHRKAQVLPMAEKLTPEKRSHMMSRLYYRFWNAAFRHDEFLKEKSA